MADVQNHPSFRLETTREDREAFHSFLHQLYREEGNISFPLMHFHAEIELNYELVKEDYANWSDVLWEGDKGIEIRLDAVRQVLDSLEVSVAIIFGVPGLLHTNKNVVGDRMIRDALFGEGIDRQRKEFYEALCSIKELVRELSQEVKEQLPQGRAAGYTKTRAIDLDEHLHGVMSARAGPRFLREGYRGRSHDGGREAYQVFISHAGEDKHTMAIPLQQRLAERGLRCFLDIEELRPGDLASLSMERAMRTVPVGVVILSPEFAAKRWPMRELECFLGRRLEGVATVIPVFYRLTKEDCGASEMFRMELEDGSNVFESLGFFDMVAKGETSVGEVREMLGKVAEMAGISNEEDAGNGSSERMARRREGLLDRIVEAVMPAMEEQDARNRRHHDEDIMWKRQL